MLTVHRRAHYRKPYVRRNGTTVRGTEVKGSSFMEEDRGRPGRGPKVFPPLKRGTLGVDFSKPERVRHGIEAGKARRTGEKHVGGQLQAISTLSRRTNPTVSRKAAADRRWVQGSFRGRKQVGYPRGFGRN